MANFFVKQSQLTIDSQIPKIDHKNTPTKEKLFA